MGNIAVDVFLLMTTMLATYQLLPALMAEPKAEPGAAAKAPSPAGTPPADSHASGKPSLCSVVLSYYRRRAQRVLPPYIVANLLILLVVAAARIGPPLGPEAEAAMGLCFGRGACPSRQWANSLFATHLQGRHACGELRGPSGGARRRQFNTVDSAAQLSSARQHALHGPTATTSGTQANAE